MSPGEIGDECVAADMTHFIAVLRYDLTLFVLEHLVLLRSCTCELSWSKFSTPDRAGYNVMLEGWCLLQAVLMVLQART